LFNSWSSRFLPFLLPALPSTEHFPLVQIEQRKASKAPKNGFSKKWKQNAFFRCSAFLKTKRHNLKNHFFASAPLFVFVFHFSVQIIAGKHTACSPEIYPKKAIS
jgi:hypothetical protein